MRLSYQNFLASLEPGAAHRARQFDSSFTPIALASEPPPPQPLELPPPASIGPLAVRKALDATAAVATAASSLIPGAPSLPAPPLQPRPRRSSILPRGAIFASAADRRLARKQALASELATRFSPRMTKNLLGEAGLRQVPGQAERCEAVARVILSHGGPDGDGLAEDIKTLDTLAEHAYQIGAPDPHCQPISSLLAHTLVNREYTRGLTNGASHSLGGASRGHAFRQSLTRLRDHYKLEIDLDPAILDSAAPETSSIPGAGREKAGTLPIHLHALIELIAMGKRPDLPAEDSVLVFFARSMLAFGILSSLRVQDMEEIERVSLDEYEPDTVICGTVRLSKNGEPIELFAPADGLLGPFHWWPSHRDACIRRGHPFPLHTRPNGSGGALAASPGFEPVGVMTGAHIRSGLAELASLRPLGLAPEQVKALKIKGHTCHGTYCDWMKAVGPWPDLFGCVEPGFQRHDRDASGHWLSFASTDQEAVPPPPKKGEKRTRSDGRNLMSERYARGAGRSGERAEQLRIRRRLISFARRALQAWCAHWGCSWLRLPLGHESKRILSEPPHLVPPEPSSPPELLRAMAALSPPIPDRSS